MVTQPKRRQQRNPYLVLGIERRFVNVLAIDQSYNECGFAIFVHGELRRVIRLNFAITHQQVQQSVQKRIRLTKRWKRDMLRSFLLQLLEQEQIECVIVERARIHSNGFASIAAFAALKELIACIIDAMPEMMPIISVDTRAWKKRAVQKGNATKQETIVALQHMITAQMAVARRHRPLTDNEADAIGMGIAFYNEIPYRIEE